MKTYNVTDYGVMPDSPELQTKKIQAALDACRENGGCVIFPEGKYYTAALRMWSDTTVYLKKGAELYGSEDCNDYEVFPIPAHVEMRSDMEMITHYFYHHFKRESWETYRRAIISAYGEKNIAIIGEAGSVIDGRNCYDANGEEGYRGPHAIFLTCCENVLLEGYTVRHSGNFLHEANNCRNLTMKKVTCLGGSDGIHLHCTEDAFIEDCVFKTGDDCIAGVNIKNMLLRRCIFNSSCNLFRIGGVNIHIEDSYAYGDGFYPHRQTVVKGKGNELPREQGRHNLLYVLDYFASIDYPYTPSDIHFKNCLIENAKGILNYKADTGPIQWGTHLVELTFENVRFTGLCEASFPIANKDEPLTVKMNNVTVEFCEKATDKKAFILEDGSNTELITE